MRTMSVKSAARVLDLLELMAALPSGLTLSEAARRLTMPKSSASALLATLVSRGYIEAGPDGYRLNARYRGGGWTGGEYGQLVQVAQPVMARLTPATGETAFLGIMTSDCRIQYIAKVVSEQPLRYDVNLGATRPAYCTSIGLVILADLADEEIEHYLATQPLEKATRDTVVDPDAIRQMIAETRRLGYASLANSNVLGTSGVAAPVRGASGRTIAGVAVIAPSSRFQSDHAVREAAIHAVVQAAADIDRTLAAFGDTVPQVAHQNVRLADAN